jgi:hypothetical protein
VIALVFGINGPHATAGCKPIDNRKRIGTGAAVSIQHGQIVEGLLRDRQAVDLVAGLLALAAPDAARCVVKDSKGTRIAAERFVRSRLRSIPCGHAHARCAQPAQELSAGYPHNFTSKIILLMSSVRCKRRTVCRTAGLRLPAALARAYH